MDKDITNRIKKEYDKKLKKEKRKERRLVANKFFDMYPDLKKDKKKIMKIINGELNESVTEDIPKKRNKNELVVEKIIYNDKTYYINEHGFILDEHVNMVGLYNETDKIIEPYLLFNKKEKKNKLFNNKKRLDDIIRDNSKNYH